MMAVAVPLAVVAILGAVVATYIFIAARVRAGQGIAASFRSILVAYFYLMSVVSLVVFSIGATSLVKVGLSDVLGRSFSYSVPYPVRPVTAPSSADVPERPADQQKDLQAEAFATAQTEQDRRSDLVQGGSLTIAGALIWALHAWGRRRIAPPTDALGSFLARAHLVVLLLLFGVGGLISLAQGLYQSLLFAVTPADSLVGRQPPGESAAMALVFVPAWAIVLAIALGELRRERTGTGAQS